MQAGKCSWNICPHKKPPPSCCTRFDSCMSNGVTLHKGQTDKLSKVYIKIICLSNTFLSILPIYHCQKINRGLEMLQHIQLNATVCCFGSIKLIPFWNCDLIRAFSYCHYKEENLFIKFRADYYLFLFSLTTPLVTVNSCKKLLRTVHCCREIFFPFSL